MRPRAPATTGPTRARRLGRATAALAAGVLAVVVLPVPSASATAYRYWSYWVGGDGGWTFATQGAARVPADGTVDGWRFAVSQATGSTTPPRSGSTFADVCAGTAPVAGHKRVGVVIDYGTAADGPPGVAVPAGPVAQCVVVAEDATGYAVLDAATDLRVESGLVCGVSGYPASGCGEAVAAGSGSGSGGGSGGGSSPRPEGGPDEAAAGSAATPGTGPGGGARTPSAGPTARSSPAAATPGPTATSTDGAASAEASPLAQPADVPADDPGGPPVGLLVGLAVVGALAAAAVALARSRG